VRSPPDTSPLPLELRTARTFPEKSGARAAQSSRSRYLCDSRADGTSAHEEAAPRHGCGDCGGSGGRCGRRLCELERRCGARRGRRRRRRRPLRPERGAASGPLARQRSARTRSCGVWPPSSARRRWSQSAIASRIGLRIRGSGVARASASLPAPGPNTDRLCGRRSAGFTGPERRRRSSSGAPWTARSAPVSAPPAKCSPRRKPSRSTSRGA
jgi:hypothetical protein